MVRRSLARRIVIAFVLLTLVVSSLFSVAVKEAINYSEDFLTESSLQLRLDTIIAERKAGKPVDLDQDMALFVTGAQEKDALPGWLAGVTPGFQERRQNGHEHHVLVRDVDGARYVLTQNQEAFERFEEVITYFLVLAVLLSVLLAWGLGSLVARRAIAPVTRLAGQVQHREQLLPLAPPLASDYPPDEVGRLAAAFDATLDKLRQALQR